MYPFWDIAIAPVLEAAAAKRVVEIGALRGETTELMLERLGPDSELHVIDPVPEFDPSEHERKFPGRYIFYRDISHNVLPTLPPVDAALIDGDHNWYTVYHELKMLDATARAARAPLPVMILHDVAWPYGRRDLYYSPERIPAEFRQPYAQRGMGRQRSTLLPEGRGGLNPTMHNAIEEGGPRNGVMTALDDFVAEHERPLRVLVLPIYWGLAIAVEEDALERRPELRRHLDWLESLEAKDELLDLGERLRVRAMVFQHNVFHDSERQLERGAHRYLDLLKGALLDEHYLENELRIDYLERCLEAGRPLELNKLRDPTRYMKPELRPLLAQRRAGHVDTDDPSVASYFPYTTMGRVRLDHVQSCLDTIRNELVGGDIVACEVGRGGGAMFMRGYLDAYEMTTPTVWVADEFRSTSASSGDAAAIGGGAGFPHLQGDLNTVRDGFERFGLFDERVRFLQGPFSDTLPNCPIEQIALLRIDGQQSKEIRTALDALYDRVTLGGYVVVDDYGTDDAKAAVDAFRSRRGIDDPLERVDWAGACWRKTRHAPAPSGIRERLAVRRVQPRSRAPLAQPAPTDRADLSVVVVFYNMRREAARTLHSLSRSYQQGVDDIDYEVIVVDNGSARGQRLDASFVESFGPNFSFVDMGDDATPSPVAALNRGISLARGDALALMIDGAHVLTPGVLRFGITGLRTFAPAIVATQQWYLGPGQQPDTMVHGYDQAYEDRLLGAIEWPTDGYRLFEIGNFIGDRDWFDGVWESNCMFVPRSVLEQVGCFEEGFAEPGGGYANLELYERLGSTPDLNVVTIIGEGSFHQLHGGTTTNQREADERRGRISSYAEHFAEMRGRSFRGPGKKLHYVGAMPPGALRTKPRRRVSHNHFKDVASNGQSGAGSAVPIPEELKVDFLDAFWHNLAWRDATWLGERVGRPPTDLFAYQEMITRVRPDWIIEFPTGNGAKALFLASICELVGNGQVLSIDPQGAEGRPEHPRIRYLTGGAVDEDVLRLVRQTVGDSPNALVILGTHAAQQRTMVEFREYSPLVPVGSYVVIEETLLNGHPVAEAFGAGPAEAVKHVLNTRGDFVPDPTLERYGVTFNHDGFLKRVK